MAKLFQNDKEIYLSREHTDCLKGLLAVVVIFSHIRGQLTVLNDTMIGQILTAAGYLELPQFVRTAQKSTPM